VRAELARSVGLAAAGEVPTPAELVARFARTGPEALPREPSVLGAVAAA
jgi:hypothetical protein